MPKYAVYSDNELVQKSKNDQQAFRELVQRYQNRIIWIAHQIVGNYEEARDIAQEAFIRVFRKLDQFLPENNFYTWLYKIVVNLCIDSWRREHHGKDISSDEAMDLVIDSREESPPDCLEKKELSEKIQYVLTQLPEQYRIMIVLRDVQGLSCKEIEDIINCNHNTVRWRLFRARSLFKEIWENSKF